MATNGLTTYIESLGVYLPSSEISSKSRVAGVASRVRIPLERFTGIKSTRRVRHDEHSFDLACRAIEQCMVRSSFNASDIGLLIACNISKYDRKGFVFPIEPNTASRLRKALGIKNAIAFDVNNACAGMFTGILIADCFLHMTGIQAALVVSGEYISHISDTAQREITSRSDPRIACLTLGDAGAAVILSRSQDAGVGFQRIGMSTLGAYSGLCTGVPSTGGEGGGIMLTDSTELLKVGSLAAANHALYSMRQSEWNWDTVDHVIPHQVSSRATEATVRMINSRPGEMRLPPKKVIDNLELRGNTATTSHLVALGDHMESGRIGPGDRVVFSLIASGLTVGTALYVLDGLPTRMREKNPAEKRSASNGHALPGHTPHVKGGPAGSPPSVCIASVATTRSRAGAPASTEEIALEAAKACLAKAPDGAQDIDVLVFAGVYKSGFVAEPSYASILAGKLFPHSNSSNGHTPILAFDVHNGPGGFLTACEILRTMVGQRQVRTGLVVSTEFENNRLLSGYAQLGVAEIASAAVITSTGDGVHVGDYRYFSFDEYEDLFTADLLSVSPAHLSFRAQDTYDARLRECILRAIHCYLPMTGQVIGDYDRFYFPQISKEFLDALGIDLGIERDRIVDVTLPGKDLYTSSIACILEESMRAGLSASGKRCLAVSAGPGINVSCATIQA